MSDDVFKGTSRPEIKATRARLAIWTSFCVQHQIAAGALVLLAVVTAAFLPFIFGDRTLQESASDSASLYFTGSRDPALGRIAALSVLDPGAAAWAGETQLALEHDIFLRERTAPIWNPYAAYGAPLAANMESQPYSPLAWIPIVWSNARAYNIFIVLRLYLAGLFAFLFLRQFVSWGASLVCGASYMFAGYLLLYLTMPHLSVEVLTPALLYGVERMSRRPNLGTAALFAVLLASSILGGMPESTFLAITFTYLYFATRLLSDRELRRDIANILLHASAATLLAGGISAVATIPFLEYVAYSFNLHSSGFYGSNFDSLSWNVLGTYLSPLFLGPPYQNIFTDFAGQTMIRGFFGCGALFFSLVAVFGRVADVVLRKPQDKFPTFFFAAVAIVLLSKRFGFALINWIGYLPGFRDIIFAKYEEAILALCIAALAGAGVARICERRASAATVWLALFVPLGLLTVVAGSDATAFLGLQQHAQYYLFGLGAALLFLALSSVAAYACSIGRIRPVFFAASALAIVIAEPLATYFIPMQYVVNESAPQAASALLGSPYVAYLKAHLKPGERFFGNDGLLYPEWSSAFNIPDATGIDALYVRRYLPFVRTFLTANSGDDISTRFTGIGHALNTALERRFLTLSSIRLVGVQRAPMDPAEYRIVYHDPIAQMYEFRSPLPRVAVYEHVVRAEDGPRALAILASPEFDPKREVVVEDNTPGIAELSRAKRVTVVAGNLEAYASRYVRASVSASRPAVVLLTDTAYPGWTAAVDGRPVPIMTVNYLFRGVLVGRGHHIVEYRYDPLTYTIGSRITLVSLLALAAAILFSRLRNRPAFLPAVTAAAR